MNKSLLFTLDIQDQITALEYKYTLELNLVNQAILKHKVNILRNALKGGCKTVSIFSGDENLTGGQRNATP